MIKSRAFRYIVIAFVVATLVGLAEGVQVHMGTVNAGRAISWARSFASVMPSWYILAALVPFIIMLARRFPLETLKTPRSLAAHFSAAALFTIVHLSSSVLLSRMIMPIVTGEPSRASLTTAMWGTFTYYFVGDILQYFGIVAVYFAVDYARRFREKERAAAELALKTSRLEASLTRANLEALRMQLNPHFLFNTLNTVSVLALKGERQKVARMLSRLGDLLRLSLENDRQTLSLREELDFLERYLEIEQVRFKDRLSVDIDVEEAAYDAEVPSLLLQPIVENALKYGFSQTIDPGHIAISGRVRSNMLELEVSDTGPGFPENRAQGVSTGVGLGNTRARLEQLYGGNYMLDLANQPTGGALVRIRVPYRRFVSEAIASERQVAKQA